MGYKKANKYQINVGTGATFNPADSTTYYFGYDFQAAPTTTAATYKKVYMPTNGTITNAYITWNGGVPTAEDLSIYIRKNNTTDYLIATIGTADAVKLFSNTNLSVPVAQGDYIELKIVCPAWVANPTTVVLSGTIQIQY